MRQVNWKEVADKAVHMTIESLVYSINDCREAAKASRGWNPENEGYYDDEASVYSAELRSRRNLIGFNQKMAKAICNDEKWLKRMEK